MSMTEDVVLLIGSYTEQQHSPTSNVVYHTTTSPVALSGWTSLRVTAGIERMPRDFELEMTELSPDPDKMLVKPGDPCTLLLAGKCVLTGFVDVVAPGMSANGHSIRVIGRGKCADLVDCSAEWPGGQISNANVFSIASKFADVYGINVKTAVDQTKLPIVPQFNLMLGESAFEIIEKVSRYSAVLCYEDAYGALQLSRVGTEMMSTGIEEGINVEAASVEFSMHQRFSEITVVMTSLRNIDDLNAVNTPPFTAFDPNVTRHRRRFVVSEAGELGWDIGKQRALWEIARRAGRSRIVRVTVDNWHDVDGNLWEPNMLVGVELPMLKIRSEQLLIAAVTFQFSEAGTHADLTLMSPDAFSPEPVLLQKVYGDVHPANVGGA
ncbi:phage baseplate assembly protein [Ralstonia pseudosolanacearum]|uniref:phage baseplate assembly protein n=1 Tax=Ralstonia pseudosolanacearum TaxID=1310165 RepID=UPI001F335D5B